jgi:hypothetical protein
MIAAVAPSQAEPLVPRVTLRGGGHAASGRALTYTATTSAQLNGAGEEFALELRGIRLAEVPRATYEDPDYTGDRCRANPCRWSLIRGGEAYEFRAFLLDLKNGGKTIMRSPPVRSTWALPKAPDAVQLLINHRQWPIEPLDGAGPDEYLDIATGALSVQAKWKNELKGSGFLIVISTSEPADRDFARCSTGTSCEVSKRVAIKDGQEMSWNVKILTSAKKLVSGFKVCLIGRA